MTWFAYAVAGNEQAFGGYGMNTLHVRLGGREKVERFALIIFDLMSHDDILAETLDRMDHRLVVERLSALLIFAFAGSPFYEGQRLRTDFKDVLAADAHYDRFTDHFATALQATGTDPELRRDALEAIERMRDYVRGRQLA